jgi:5,10-methylenetetrahydromethanopterin reductase
MAIKLSVGLFQSGPVTEVVRLAQVAESLGFDGLWLNDAQCPARIPTCVSAEPDAKRYVRSRVGVTLLYRAPANLDEAEMQAVEKIRRAHDPQEHRGLNASYAEHVTDSLIDKFALAGPPEECLEKMRALIRTGVDELNLTFMHPDTEGLLRTFARTIIEKL